MDSFGANSSVGSSLRSDAVIHERRRRPRQPAHTPAYAMLALPADGAAVEFNEILDATEDGVCISSPESFELNQALTLCLDLPEIQSQLQTTAHVVWSEKGRTGLRFSGMPQPSLHELREWLHLNGIVAAADRKAADAAEPPSVVRHDDVVSLADDVDSPQTPDFSSLLLALEAVRRETLALAPNLNAALQHIAECAQTFTRASGAAIALFQGNTDEMICRASAGDAPGIGSALHVGSGFSGQCVRTGRLLRCDDSELNLFVDRESCRALGIRSMVAIPIGAVNSVQGLIEVFSPRPATFTTCDDAVLSRLADITQATLHGGSKPASNIREQVDAEVVTDEKLRSVMAELSSSHSRRLAYIVVAAVLALVALSLVIPRFQSRDTAPAHTQASPATATPASGAVPGHDLDSLLKLADNGDPAAQFAVGAHYATGDGVIQDYSEAVHWFTRAAEQGHVVAQGTLGAYYWNALGVHQDLNQAYFWSILAEAGGDQAIKYRASILASRLTRAEVIAAQQQANDWLKVHQKPSAAR